MKGRNFLDAGGFSLLKVEPSSSQHFVVGNCVAGRRLVTPRLIFDNDDCLLFIDNEAR